MEFYHDLITEKSWKFLQELKRRYSFILIGGWAVYLYTHALKSKDIDFICNYEALEKLKKEYDLMKNDRLKKYEIHCGEFDIDIYTPFYSDLRLAVEDLEQMTRSLQGFTVLEPEALLILKQYAYKDRSFSAKGEKDKIDIIALLSGSVDVKKYKKLLARHGIPDYCGQLISLLQETREVPELSLSQHAFSKLKKDILRNLLS